MSKTSDIEFIVDRAYIIRDKLRELVTKRRFLRNFDPDELRRAREEIERALYSVDWIVSWIKEHEEN